MKKILAASVIALTAFTAQAQKDTSGTSGISISVNGGIASPTGNFSKGDYADFKSGFVKTGGHVNISAIYHFSKGFGINVLAGYSQFRFKNTQSLADGYKEDSGTDSTTLYNKGNTHTFSILAGPYVSLNLTDKLGLDIRVLGGYTTTHLAGFQVYYEDYTDNVMTQKEASKGSFGLQGGLGVHYDITPKLFVQVNADYFWSKPDIGISYENFIVNSGRRLSNYKEAITGINATAGIGIRLF